jgi:hypothetical protein
VEAGYARVPPAVDETARMLGSGPWRLFTQLHLPLLQRSALAAALLVFVDVMKELPATLVLRPFGSDTLAVVAFNFARDERLAKPHRHRDRGRGLIPGRCCRVRCARAEPVHGLRQSSTAAPAMRPARRSSSALFASASA